MADPGSIHIMKTAIIYTWTFDVFDLDQSPAYQLSKIERRIRFVVSKLVV